MNKLTALIRRFLSLLNHLFSKFKRSKSESVSQKRQMSTSFNPIKSVGMRLFIMFFVCIVLFVLVSGYSSYTVSKRIIEDKISDASSTTVKLVSEKTDLMLKGYEDITTEIVTNMDFKIQLSSLTLADIPANEMMQIQLDLKGKISQYAYNDNAIKSISIVPINDSLPSISFMDDVIEVEDSSWIDVLTENMEQPIWLGVLEKETVSPSLVVGRSIRGFSDKVDYMIFLELKLNAIETMFEEVEISESTYFQIIDKNSDVVYSTDSARMFQPSAINFTQNETGEPYNTIDSSGVEQIVSYHHSDYANWDVMAVSPVEELVQDTKIIQNATNIIALIAALLAIVIGYFVANMIGKPLRNLRDLMLQGAEGNLAVRTDSKRTDEIGEVGKGFNLMMEQITLLVEQTNRSAQDVLSTASQLSEASKQTSISAKEIAVATDQIANGASNLAMDAERGNELTHQMGVKMKAVIGSNVEMGESASEVRKVSEQGTTFMNELITKTNVTEEMTRNMVEKVDKLKESTTSIRKILDLLNGITKQTNILSLNATIEAARAGAAGKGFMVVADEIRRLADQSKQSIEVVGEIVETIQSEIEETVNVLSDAHPIFKEQIHAVKETDLIFKNVHNQMSGFVTSLDEVTDSIQQLEQSQIVLSEAMSNVSAVSEQSSATSEEVASLSSQQLTISGDLVGLAEKLETLSSELKESLSRFHTS